MWKVVQAGHRVQDESQEEGLQKWQQTQQLGQMGQVWRMGQMGRMVV